MICTINDMLQTNHPLLLRSSDKELTEGIKTGFERDFDFEEEHYIICRNCGHTITSLEHIIAINGQHRHTLTNPAGITFEIGCFSFADGCVIYGNPTFEFTWFEGYSWNFAHCSICVIHLGWYYQSGMEKFFGLIVDRLMETTKTH